MPLPTGKVSPYELAEIIFPKLEMDDDRVLVSPDVGLDASIVELEDRVLALSSDPITGALEEPGWLSVHVNANDVATMAADPRWYLMTLFLPVGAEKSEISEIVDEAKRACEELEISLVGGHTEVTPGLERALISGTMVGEAPKDRWVSSAGAEPGDRIIFTKTAAVEGTYVLAVDKEKELDEAFSEKIVERAKGFKGRLSVVQDALAAVESGEIHAMHDPTEGGLVGGLHELADASEVGFSIKPSSIPLAEETEKICEHFDIDPFRSIGSGSLLATASPDTAESVVEALEEKGIRASDIGKVLEDESDRKMDGETLEFPEQDELWRIF